MTVESLADIRRRYAGSAERPLGSFVALMATYSGLVSAATLVLRARGVEVPERVSWRDLALMSVATFRLSRLLTKDPVTSPLRAPFVRFEGQSGEAEVAEKVVGKGPQKAVGELITCPFCFDQWVATALTIGWLASPRRARLVASVLTVVSTADLLQFGYDKLQSS
jgi:hypothetical protein